MELRKKMLEKFCRKILGAGFLNQMRKKMPINCIKQLMGKKGGRGIEAIPALQKWQKWQEGNGIGKGMQ
jgi:hypothetical protein